MGSGLELSVFRFLFLFLIHYARGLAGKVSYVSVPCLPAGRLRQICEASQDGAPVWFLDGNLIVGYDILKDGVRLLFWSGLSFGVPKRLWLIARDYHAEAL